MVKHRGRSQKEDDLLELYLNDIGKYPLLNREDEVRLGALVQAGKAAADCLAAEKHTPRRVKELKCVVAAGEDAAQEFVRANLRLVVAVAKRFQSCGMSLLDLVQEGNLGLLQAVERFDPTRGFKFSTYATWWIRQTISRGVANSSRAIRLPVHASEQLLAVRLATSALEARLGHPPTTAEVAEAAHLSARKVSELLPFLADPVSLSERSGESETELGDTVMDASPMTDQAALTAMLPAQVRALLSKLDPREQEVLCLRYGLDRGLPRTLEEVGEHFGLTREGARLIEAKAMSKLRMASRRDARDLLTA